MKKRVWLSLLPALLAVGVAGCLFREAPYREVGYYDLSTPEKNPADGAALKIGTFKSIETGKYKMVYRDGGCRIIVDEYNKWVQPPEVMVARYLQAAFSSGQPLAGNSAGSEFTISGVVFMFSIDLKSRKAALGVAYQITGNPESGGGSIGNSCVMTAGFEQESPADFAQAMSACAELLAKRLRADIDFLKKQERGR